MPDSRLPALLGIFREEPASHDPRWLEVEHSLGLTLPASYKAIVEQFGASPWGDFLYVLSPFHEKVGLLSVANRILDADRESREQFPEHYPLPLYPEPGGLFPWAVTDNGDTLYFITAGPPPQWPTLVRGPRAPEFEVHFLPPPLLVHHFAAGLLQSSILPRPDA